MLTRVRVLLAAAGFVGTFPWSTKVLGWWHPLTVVQEGVDLHSRHYDCGTAIEPWGQWPVLVLQLGLPAFGALLSLLALAASLRRGKRPAAAPALSAFATVLAVVGVGAMVVAVVPDDILDGSRIRVVSHASAEGFPLQLSWALFHFVPFLALGLQARKVWRWGAGFCLAMSVYFAVAGTAAALLRADFEREIAVEVQRLRSGGAPKVNVYY